MTEVKKEESSTELQKSEERKIRRVIRPEFTLCGDAEGTGYVGEVILPGADRDSIRLRMSEDFVSVEGKHEDVHYSRTLPFGCQVDPETARSTYKEGLLTFQVEFKEPEFTTVDVEVK